MALRTLILTIIALAIGSLPAQADEPMFGFIYTTDLLPKGQKEIEQWLTWRHQKAGGYYDQLENRTEFSYGVTDVFQLSGYLNYNWTRAFHNAVDGTTTLPEQFADFRRRSRRALQCRALCWRFTRRDLPHPQPVYRSGRAGTLCRADMGTEFPRS